MEDVFEGIPYLTQMRRVTNTKLLFSELTYQIL